MKNTFVKTLGALFILPILASSIAYASEVRNLEQSELITLNYLLQCPKEVAEVMQSAQRITSGKAVSDRPGNSIRYEFSRQNSFTTFEAVANLTVSRTRRENPPTDAPDFTVGCQLEYVIQR